MSSTTPNARDIAEKIANHRYMELEEHSTECAVILARAYLELEKELKAHNEYQKWGPTKVIILDAEIAKLKEEKDKFQKLFSQECNYREQLLFKVQELERLKNRDNEPR